MTICKERVLQRHTLGRRALLCASGALATGAVLSMPAIRPSWATMRSLKVSLWAGGMEEGFRESLYPEFTKASGIAVESQPQAEGARFLVELSQANKNGTAPDLCSCADVDLFSGRALGIWQPLDTSKIANVRNVPVQFIQSGPAGVDGIGFLAFLMTFVVNPNKVSPLPDSWTELWRPTKVKWGLHGGGDSALFEIAAHLYFGGPAMLDTEAGIDNVAEKIAELKPRAQFWWTDEITMQTALQNDEVAGGMYFHDVAGSLAKAGAKIVSIIPKEGAVAGVGSWCQPSASTKIAETREFISFFCTPEAQQLIARRLGSAPVLPRSMLDLTDAEFAAVSSDIKPIPSAGAARAKFGDYFEQAFKKIVAA